MVDCTLWQVPRGQGAGEGMKGAGDWKSIHPTSIISPCSRPSHKPSHKPSTNTHALNANLAHPATHHYINISTLIHKYHLEDAISLFQQKCNNTYTWHQKCTNLPTQTNHCDYILTPYQHCIASAKICNSDFYKMDHYALWILLPGIGCTECQCIKCHLSTLPNIKLASNPKFISNCKVNILQEHKTTLKTGKSCTCTCNTAMCQRSLHRSTGTTTTTQSTHHGTTQLPSPKHHTGPQP